jgi:hypothetical protein
MLLQFTLRDNKIKVNSDIVCNNDIYDIVLKREREKEM